MKRRVLSLTLATGFLIALGCQTTIDVLPSEEFRWCGLGQTVAFSPPSPPWERAKHQERETGVSFTRRDVPPGFISVGEYTNVCRQDPLPALRYLETRFDDLNADEFQKASLAGHRFLNSGFSDEGNRIIERINRYLTQAEIAHRQRNHRDAKIYVTDARREAENLDYRLGDLVEPYLFNAEGFPDRDRFRIEAPVRGVLCGVSSITINYTLDEERGIHHGRKVYAAWNNHLFVFSYLGPEKYMPVFERMLNTVSFPMLEPFGETE